MRKIFQRFDNFCYAFNSLVALLQRRRYFFQDKVPIVFLFYFFDYFVNCFRRFFIKKFVKFFRHFFKRGRKRLKRIRDKFRIVADKLHRRVYFVCDSGGKLSDCLHLPRQIELVFHLNIFGNVFLYGKEIGNFSFFVKNRRNYGVFPKVCSVFCSVLKNSFPFFAGSNCFP